MVAACAAAWLCGEARAKPLKVYILAGPSNMEGQGHLTTIDYIGDDPVTALLLKEIRGDDGRLVACEKVWISNRNSTCSSHLPRRRDNRP